MPMSSALDGGAQPAAAASPNAPPTARFAPLTGDSTDAGTRGNIANAAKVVAGMRGGFRDCYNQALKVDGVVHGSCKLTLEVDADGRIASATGESTLPASFVECIFDEVGRHRFDPPEGGHARVNVPVTFVRQ
jgi:hypothetical protein